MFPSAQIKMRLLSPSSSPATSPTMSNSSSPTPPTPLNYNHKITGIPCVAAASRYTAPVHIDVGGTIYTSSLETLTKLIFYFTARGPPRVITALKERGRGALSGILTVYVNFVARAILSTVDDNHIWLCCPFWESRDASPQVIVYNQGYPESRLAKLFNGSIPIVLDSLKQHYFIDRDGGMFRHILNFMRNSRLLIPENFADLDLLLEESRYFDIAPMCRQLEQMKKDRLKNGTIATSIKSTGSPGGGGGGRGGGGDTDNHQQSPHHEGYECVALHISPDLGERIMLSGERALLDEVFPETNQALLDARSSVAWNQHDTRHVIRFPLNGYCKLNSVQAITRLLNAGFRVAASNGGGVEGQQFSEYLFVRKVFPV
uniref:BTB/POZ domain-containing protein KCTD15 n=2 Tax=Timema TaxID=61471 RepID=A0A7R9FI80_9NEOP|nr:unnamed protein product [Timema tahoe]